ncbi:MAG TPA: ABC transporter ATP-binding protein [Ideonella sp.]|uniref:ABC transporter ATP-binding protein n=1 Tax=Ideonella sp. TaxID=1929293 RepID=UPI002BC89135|nr:ABC transporter ATP-binding protein [Ideonella sp.]
MSFLEVQAACKRYGRAQVLDHVDLDVASGSRTVIVGPSGSGKTTLLRLIAGFELPDSGRIVLAGQTLADGADALPAHRRGIGFVPQDGALFPHLSVADNIGFGLPRNAPGRAQRIAELMEMVALPQAMLARRPHELSGGQQQRVALARALAQRPQLMLLDEPFSALDTGLRASTRKAVAELLGGAGITTILVTHDQAEALSFADQVAVMRAGRLVQVGRPLELYLQPQDPETASFLGDTVILPAQLQQGWADCALGRIATDDPRGQGAVQIMLRPEQLQLQPVSGHGEDAAAASGAGACRGVVTEVDFGGSVCGVAVRLLGDQPGSAAPILVRSPAVHVPAVGDSVSISVLGRAHVFGAAAA